jgi:hypothetical protein
VSAQILFVFVCLFVDYAASEMHIGLRKWSYLIYDSDVAGGTE